MKPLFPLYWQRSESAIRDTETLTGIRLDTAQGFARCELGQAALTEEQARILQDIIDNLQ